MFITGTIISYNPEMTKDKCSNEGKHYPIQFMYMFYSIKELKSLSGFFSICCGNLYWNKCP